MPIIIKVLIAIFSLMSITGGISIFSIGIHVHDNFTIIFGIVFALCGLSVPVIWLRKILIKRYVLKHGEIIYADFLDYVHASYSIQGYTPKFLRAQWLDESANLIYHFKSEAITQRRKRKLPKGAKEN